MEVIPLPGKGVLLLFSALQAMFWDLDQYYLSISLYQNGSFAYLSYCILSMLKMIKCDI